MNRTGSRGSGAPPAPPHAPEAPNAGGRPAAKPSSGPSSGPPSGPSSGSAAERSPRPPPRGRRAEPAPRGPTGAPGAGPGASPGDGARGDGIDTDRRSAPSRQASFYGPRSLGALLPAITRPAFKKRAPSAAQIMADWVEIAGPALSAVTRPRRVAAGTLTLSCSGPIAMELQHMQAELLARINGHLGRVVVDRLRFVQDAPPGPTPWGDPSRRDGGAGRARGGTSAARPHERAIPPVRVSGVPPGPLHDALAALGRAVARGAAREDP